MTVVTGIAPIVHTVEVKAPPARAFAAFAGRMGDWWPRGRTIGAMSAESPHVAVVIEPRSGGRWYERDAAGRETDWGRVIAWEPPSRLLLAWQINAAWAFDPALVTELELTFVPRDGGTCVTLEHRDLERLGSDAAEHIDMLRNGWPGMMQGYVACLDGSAG